MSLGRAPETGIEAKAPLLKGRDLEVSHNYMKKILALAMVLGVLGSVLVGCSGGSSDAAATDAAATPAKDSTPKTADGE